MSVMVVGGDYLGGIEKNLLAMGVTNLVHVSGRKMTDAGRMHVPKGTAFVLVLTDYVNHNAAKLAKMAAKAQHVPMVFAKRSWSDVEEKLQKLNREKK